MEQVAGRSTVVACASAAPLRLVTCRARGRAAWVVATSYGGGLVAGDALSVDVTVGDGATLLLTTPAETKVYRSTGAAASQRLDADVGDGGVLALLPDAVSPFAESRYRQVQRLRLHPRASALVVDAVVAGRVARGERWALRELVTRNEVSVADRLVLADAQRLSSRDGLTIPERLRDTELLATVIAVGPAFARLAAELRQGVLSRVPDATDPLLVAAGSFPAGAHVRIAARSVEIGNEFLRRLLASAEAVLGVAPFTRRP